MQFKDVPERASLGGGFVKLGDGDSITGVFAGDPVEFVSQWDNGKSTVSWPSEGGRFNRFRINFITKDDGKLVPKIFEQGIQTYKTLGMLARKHDLSKTTCMIIRNGTGKLTRYSVTTLPDGGLSSNAVEALSKIELIDVKKTIDNSFKKETPPPSNDEMPDWVKDDSVDIEF